MKKLAYLFFLTLLFAACSKSNEKPALTPANATAAGIAGKWKVATDTTSQVQQSQLKTNAIAAPLDFIVFNADGSGNLINADGEVTENFTFTVANAVIKMINKAPEGATAEQDLTILSLSPAKMVLRGTQSETFTDIGLIKQ